MDAPRRVYLDNNATTPLDPIVLEAMMPFFQERFGNASSRNHAFGWEAKEAVERSREAVADLIGASSKEIYFTSGATESNNLALKGIMDANPDRGNHLVTSLTEHHAVLDPSHQLKKQGYEVTYLSVDSNGLISIDELQNAITDRTVLVSILYANNETGIIQPIREIAQVTHERGTVLMTDATQAIGKIPVSVDNDGIDVLTLSAHKFYGPKGVGALYIRSNPKVKVASLVQGGGHEKGIRSGTLNVPGIVGLGESCKVAKEKMEEDYQRLGSLRNRLEESLLQLPNTSINGSSDRLPHVTNITFNGIDGERMLLSLNDIALSQGSACSSSTFEPSHVLKAMGLSDDQAFSSIRFGLGRFTTKEDIDYTIKRIEETINQLSTQV